MAAPVTTAREGQVLLATIDDGKVNAVGFEIADGLHAALDEAVADDDVKAVVIAGRDGTFCAGFHLPTMKSDKAMDLMGSGGRLALRMFELPKPLVLAVTGHALAMGAVLLLAADHRVGVSGDKKIGLNEVRIGLPLPPFASMLARHRLDPRHLTQATQLAGIYDPEGACEVGFLDEVVDGGSDKVVAHAVEQAATWANDLDPGAFAATRGYLRGPVIDALRPLIAGA